MGRVATDQPRLTFATALVHHVQVGLPAALGRQEFALVLVGEAVRAAHLKFPGEVGTVRGAGAVRTPKFHLTHLAGPTIHAFATLWEEERNASVHYPQPDTKIPVFRTTNSKSSSRHKFLVFRTTNTEFFQTQIPRFSIMNSQFLTRQAIKGNINDIKHPRFLWFCLCASSSSFPFSHRGDLGIVESLRNRFIFCQEVHDISEMN